MHCAQEQAWALGWPEGAPAAGGSPGMAALASTCVQRPPLCRTSCEESGTSSLAQAMRASSRDAHAAHRARAARVPEAAEGGAGPMTSFMEPPGAEDRLDAGDTCANYMPTNQVR